MSSSEKIPPDDALDANAIRVGKGRPLDLTHEVASPTGNPLERLLAQECMAVVQQRMARLETRDNAMLQTRYGFNGEERSLRETGQAVGGVSGELVRQRESKALRDMRWNPRELEQLDSVPSISPVSGRLENIVVLAQKIPLVVQGWMKSGIETTDQLEIMLKKAVPSPRDHVVNLGFSDLLSGKFLDANVSAGKRYSKLFEAGCKLAHVPVANAFDRPLVPLGSVKFGRMMAEQKATRPMKPGA